MVGMEFFLKVRLVVLIGISGGMDVRPALPYVSAEAVVIKLRKPTQERDGASASIKIHEPASYYSPNVG